MERETTTAFATRHFRWNYAVLFGDFAFYGLALSFISTSTIMPALAEQLGASNLVIGAIPALFTLGLQAPGIFFANATERMPLKLPFVMRYTLGERVPFLVIGLATLVLGSTHPGLVLAALLVMVALAAGTGGVLVPAWSDLVAKVIPVSARGGLFAYSNAAAGLLGLIGTGATAYFLERFAFPLNFSLCFFAAFAATMGSFVVLGLAREQPEVHEKLHVSFRSYVGRLPSVVRSDRGFSWFLVARAAGTASTLANGFFTADALVALHAADWQVAFFTTCQLAGQTAATIVFGQIGDRRGHKPVLVICALLTLAANLIAFLATDTSALYAVFALTGAAVGGFAVSNLNLTMEYAPAADRPTYVALGSAAVAPWSLLGPIAGGLIADRFGYPPVFTLAGFFAVLSAIVFLARTRDPRRGRAVKSDS